MPKFKHSNIIPFQPKEMFDLVMDIEKYPEFLPWCKRAKIVNKSIPDNVIADLTLKFKAFESTYRSSIWSFSKNEIHSISIKSNSKLFSHFNSSWDFIKCETGTKIVFEIDFGLKINIFENFVSSHLRDISTKIIASFESRAKDFITSNLIK